MRTVEASGTYPGSVHEAESVWYQTSRWPSFIDGLERVVSVEGPWPQAGATVIWQSVPAGRGRVVERVVSHEPLAGQTVELEDESIRGRQTVTFTPAGQRVAVALRLEYELRRQPITTRLVDLLFIRRAFAASLDATIRRFGSELAGARAADPGGAS